MKEFFHSVKFKIIVALMAVLLGAMIYSVTTGGYSSGSSYIFETVFEPVRSLSSKISEKVSTSLDMLINAEKYYNENIQLKEQLNSLYNDVIDYDKVLEENRELRVMLGLKEEYSDFEFSPPCTVIARTTNDPYASFTVDKGENDGIKPGDPVVTESGIVGVCYEVSRSTCKVRTLYSPKTAVFLNPDRTALAFLRLSDAFEKKISYSCFLAFANKAACTSSPPNSASRILRHILSFLYSLTMSAISSFFSIVLS